MAKLDQLDKQKHALDAELLLCLSEIERRRLYREQACSSLFEFCVVRLGQSEDVAYKRVGAARLMLDYPEIHELLARGRIHLTGLMLLKPHLTAANHQEWLSAASGKSKRQIEKLIATRLPRPDVPTSERRLPRGRAQALSTIHSSNDPTQDVTSGAPLAATTPVTSVTPLAATTPVTSVTPQAASSALPPQVSAAAISAAPPGTAQSLAPSLVGNQPNPAPSATHSRERSVAAAAQIAPLSSHSYRIVFTASECLKQKLDRARELLSHAISPSDLPAILERALDQLIEREERRRYGAHAKRAASSPLVRAAGAARNEQAASSRREMRQPGSQLDDVRQSAANETLHPASLLDDLGQAGPQLSDLCQFRLQLSDVRHFVLSEHACPDCETSERALPEVDLHASCQKYSSGQTEQQDPDPNFGTRTGLMGVRKHTESGEDRAAGESIQSALPGGQPRCAEPVGVTASKVKVRSRYVPAAVRRQVWTRDAGQCTFVDCAGRRCEQRHFLELDHREAFAIGGTATVENLRLRCRAHNNLEAERLFGLRRIQGAIAHAKQNRTG